MWWNHLSWKIEYVLHQMMPHRYIEMNSINWPVLSNLNGIPAWPWSHNSCFINSYPFSLMGKFINQFETPFWLRFVIILFIFSSDLARNCCHFLDYFFHVQLWYHLQSCPHCCWYPCQIYVLIFYCFWKNLQA